MSYNPDDPILAPVYMPSVAKLTTFYIHEVTLVLTPQNKDGMTMHVRWSEGYLDSGKYIANQMLENDFSGDEFIKMVNTAVTPGLSRYDEVKDSIWQFMESQGLVQKGKIE